VPGWNHASSVHDGVTMGANPTDAHHKGSLVRSAPPIALGAVDPGGTLRPSVAGVSWPSDTLDEGRERIAGQPASPNTGQRVRTHRTVKRRRWAWAGHGVSAGALVGNGTLKQPPQ
jgi:hypothetical protein